MGFKMNPLEPTGGQIWDKETKEEVVGQSGEVDANMSRRGHWRGKLQVQVSEHYTSECRAE